MDRETISNAVLDAAAEAYTVSRDALSESSEYKSLFAYSSSKVLKTALFIGENLDLEEDLGYADIADHRTLGDTIDMLLEKLA
jgi:hypothetical protein